MEIIISIPDKYVPILRDVVRQENQCEGTNDDIQAFAQALVMREVEVQ